LGDLIATDASWSPDGQRVAYFKRGDHLVARNDGTEVRKLTSFPGSPGNVVWSPDGRKVRFSFGAWWEVSLDGQNPQALLPAWNTAPKGTPHWDCRGNFMRDGKYFVFTSYINGSSNIWAVREKTGLWERR
jgi:Tol biopolymer transport system component